MGRAVIRRARRPRARFPEGQHGPEVITLPVLVGGKFAGQHGPTKLVPELERDREVYYAHAVAYPHSRVVIEAMVAERDKLKAGALLWDALGDRLKTVPWRPRD